MHSHTNRDLKKWWCSRAHVWASESGSLVALGKPQNPPCSTSPLWERESSLIHSPRKAVVTIEDCFGKQPGHLLQLINDNNKIK